MKEKIKVGRVKGGPPPQDYEDVGDNCKNIGKDLT